MAKLNSHLVVKEEGKAFDETVLVFGDVRISVILDGTMSDDEIIPLIEDSFLLTMPKKNKTMQENR